jgi:hypothetical protein
MFETKMDEMGLKAFHPYNIILATQFGKEVGRNISTCESHDLGFSGVFLSKGSLQLLEVTSKGFQRSFFLLMSMCYVVSLFTIFK